MKRAVKYALVGGLLAMTGLVSFVATGGPLFPGWGLYAMTVGFMVVGAGGFLGAMIDEELKR